MKVNMIRLISTTILSILLSIIPIIYFWQRGVCVSILVGIVIFCMSFGCISIMSGGKKDEIVEEPDFLE